MPRFSAVLNCFFPPQCLKCQEVVLQSGALCSTCWQCMTFISPPYCECCGLPFEYAIGQLARCAACLADPPPFAQARAALHYDDETRALLTGFKYRDAAQLAPTLGNWLHQATQEVAPQAELIVPVPLHYQRFLKRRYNQSALLALQLSRRMALPHLPDGLIRHKRTQPQTGLTRKERQQNVKRAFKANPRHMGNIAGKRVLLVDDVYTTGATLGACAHALLKAGAQHVYAVTVARRV